MFQLLFRTRLLVRALALLFVTASVAACNTVEGVGEDVQAGGRAVERAAR